MRKSSSLKYRYELPLAINLIPDRWSRLYYFLQEPTFNSTNEKYCPSLLPVTEGEKILVSSLGFLYQEPISYDFDLAYTGYISLKKFIINKMMNDSARGAIHSSLRYFLSSEYEKEMGINEGYPFKHMIIDEKVEEAMKKYQIKSKRNFYDALIMALQSSLCAALGELWEGNVPIYIKKDGQFVEKTQDFLNSMYHSKYCVDEDPTYLMNNSLSVYLDYLDGFFINEKQRIISVLLQSDPQSDEQIRSMLFDATKKTDIETTNSLPIKMDDSVHPKRKTTLLLDLSPQIRTMTTMRFPINLSVRRSHNEKALYRRTNHIRHQTA